MKTAIVYYSRHHGNTRKLLDAIAASDGSVTLVDVTEQPDFDLSAYERIGLASGIYFNTFAKQMLSYIGTQLPEGKDVFFIYTHGAASGNFAKDVHKLVFNKKCRLIGEYHCLGFDTFGPFKLLGGIAKGHPNDEEIAAAVRFYQSL